MTGREESVLRALAHGLRPQDGPYDADRLAAIAEYHRIAPLILDRWPDDDDVSALVDPLRAVAAGDAARDMRQVHALHVTLDSCRSAGVEALVLKGAAFGPMLYGASERRPRLDVDVWVDGWDAVESVAGHLRRVGYRPTHQLPGRLARHALSLRREGRDGAAVDLHARPSRRWRITTAFPFSDVFERRVRGEVGGHEFWAPRAADALALAALHLASHHAGHRLPWIHLEDLARLAVRVEEWQPLVETLREHQLATAFQRTLRAASEWAPGVLPEWVQRKLAKTDDASRRFENDVHAVVDDLMFLSSRQAASYLAELAFPPAEYLHRHFGIAQNRPLPLLWSWRLLGGAIRRLRR